MIYEQSSAVRSALRTLDTERRGLDALDAAMRKTVKGGLGAAFSQAVDAIAAAPGRAIVTGMGKSGHVARKIAATLASTGQPAAFVHPAEASHGDLGMVQNGDVVIALSWSGETVELAAIVTYAKRFAIPLDRDDREADSALGREADVCLVLPARRKPARTASRRRRRPRCSSCSATLWRSRCWRARALPRAIFATCIPAASLARSSPRARRHAQGRRIPRIRLGANLSAAIVEMSSKGFGCVGVFDGGRLVGIVTDGDLRRCLKAGFSLDTPVADVMTRKPRTISPDALVAQALEPSAARSPRCWWSRTTRWSASSISTT